MKRDAYRCRHYARLLVEVAFLIEYEGVPLVVAMHMLGLVKELTP